MRIFCCLVLILGLLILSACQFVEKILGATEQQGAESWESLAATEPVTELGTAAPATEPAPTTGAVTEPPVTSEFPNEGEDGFSKIY